MMKFSEYMFLREAASMSDAIREHLAGLVKMQQHDGAVFGNLPVDSFKKQLIDQLPKAIPWFKQQGIPAEAVYSAVGQLQTWPERAKTVNDLVKALSGQQPADQTQPAQKPVKPRPQPEPQQAQAPPQQQMPQQPQLPAIGAESPMSGM